MKNLEEEIFDQYKKLGRGSWGKDLMLWKTMYNAYLTQMKEEELTPLTEMMLDILLSIPKARKEGKPIIMYPFNYEPELLFSMNLEPLMQEVMSVGLAPFHLNEPYIDLANKMGYGDNPTLCNAQRPYIGLISQGAAPIPDLLLYLSTPCNSISASYQVIEYLTGLAAFNIDVPYWAYNQEDIYYDDKTVDYMVTQTKNLISWLENNTTQKFDEERFQQTMIRTNEARSYVLEFNDFLKSVPCPMPSISGFWGSFFTMVTRGGTAEAVKTTKWFRDTAAENVKNGIGGVLDEKIRIAWPYTHVFFDQDLLPWLEETYNAVVIMDLLGHYKVVPHDTSTIENCYESLAKGTLDASMVGTLRGPIEYYLEYIINYVRDYKIDAVIFPVHYACKHVYPMARVASEAIREETGVPSLIFGCDSYDSREVTSEAIRGQISEFLTQIVF